MQRVRRPGDNQVSGIESKGQAARLPLPFALELDGNEWRLFNNDRQFFGWCDEDMATNRLAEGNGSRLLYTSDADDEPLCVDLGGSRNIQKKNNNTHTRRQYSNQRATSRPMISRYIARSIAQLQS